MNVVHVYFTTFCGVDQVSEEELTPEYKEERDALLNLIRTNLIPKEKNGEELGGDVRVSTTCMYVLQESQSQEQSLPHWLGCWFMLLMKGH